MQSHLLARARRFALGAAAVTFLAGCALVDSWPSAESSYPAAPSGERLPAPGRGETGAESYGAVEQRPLSGGALWAPWNELRGDAYELDGVERWLAPKQRLECDQESLVSYGGTRLRYAGAVRLREPFKERLVRFEQVAADTALEVYGREPRLVRHYGAYNCRPTRNRKQRISEHALGNAFDLVGFDFGPATKAAPMREDLPKELRWAFQVRVAKHWSAKMGTPSVHARFLALLTRRLQERDDIFRSMFGPGHGGHDDHLHLDAAPWRYVDL